MANIRSKAVNRQTIDIGIQLRKTNVNERNPPFQGIYYFYIAADKGSFKLAAETLFVTAAYPLNTQQVMSV